MPIYNETNFGKNFRKVNKVRELRFADAACCPPVAAVLTMQLFNTGT